MMNRGEGKWIAPFAPGPIDSMRRRAAPIPVKRIQYTLPIKHKLNYDTQLYLVHPTKEPIQIILHK